MNALHVNPPRSSLPSPPGPRSARPRVYVCGSTGFVETVARWLQELGHAAADIHTERFGGL